MLIMVGGTLVATGCDGTGLGTGPAAPDGLSATSADAEIGLTWNTVDEADSYNVYRSTDSGSEVSGEPVAEAVTETEYTDTAVTNGTTYYYQVTAVTSDGTEGDASSEVGATPFAEPPTRPE